jgi:hypothetical protein
MNNTITTFLKNLYYLIRKFTADHCAKIALSNTGRVFKPESIEKMKYTKKITAIRKQNILASNSFFSDLTIKLIEELNLCQNSD